MCPPEWVRQIWQLVLPEMLLFSAALSRSKHATGRAQGLATDRGDRPWRLTVPVGSVVTRRRLCVLLRQGGGRSILRPVRRSRFADPQLVRFEPLVNFGQTLASRLDDAPDRASKLVYTARYRAGRLPLSVALVRKQRRRQNGARTSHNTRPGF